MQMRALERIGRTGWAWIAEARQERNGSEVDGNA